MNSWSYRSTELRTQQDSSSYEKLTEFEKGRVIGMKEAGSAKSENRSSYCSKDAAIGRYLQERVDNGIFQRHDGSG
ncbi:hypothetical protein TNCV_5137681 [Trichonephila clavipes]|nr:hypothetical protein TNCV_5137681 [Trichonephila clavipes]